MSDRVNNRIKTDSGFVRDIGSDFHSVIGSEVDSETVFRLCCLCSIVFQWIVRCCPDWLFACAPSRRSPCFGLIVRLCFRWVALSAYGGCSDCGGARWVVIMVEEPGGDYDYK